MAIATSVSKFIVNPGALGGDQNNTVTAALPNGGYVVAWTTNGGSQSDVVFQRFDGLGKALGGPVTANTTLVGDQTLRDIAVTADGHFVLAWTASSKVTTRAFDAATGAASSAEVNFTSLAAATGAQLVALSGAQYKVIFSSDNVTSVAVEQASFDTSGAVVAAKTTINALLAQGTRIGNASEGNIATEQWVVLSDGSILSTANTLSAPLPPKGATDLMKLQNGTHVLAGETSASISLTALFTAGGLGTGSNFFGPAVSSGPTLVSGTGDVFDRVLVNLGGGRIFAAFVADTGQVFNQLNGEDGIYATIYNTNTGIFEGPATLVRGFGQIQVSQPLQLTGLDLDATLLSDGRVNLSWSEQNGLTGFDIFSAIFDPRSGPVTLKATVDADLFVGTSQAGDTVDYSTAGAFRLDLVNPLINTGSAAGDSLSLIENVIGSGSADDIYGNAAANTLSGGVGDDRVVGREGDDTLSGGAGNDTLLGGTGDDELSGDLGNDLIAGGAGNDTIDGGANNDRISGGAGTDVIAGNIGDDKIYGGAGDDLLDGGANNDFVSGGDGDDTIFTADGDDTINGGAGDDVIDAGVGNDVINAGTGFDHANGGAGVDTITYLNSIVTGESGVAVDLDPAADPIGNVTGNASDDVLVNIENVTGSQGDDYIAGDALANVLRGSAGADTLFGRAGNDTLFGGAGADFFLFVNAGGGNDAIRDFAPGTDKILLDSSGFGGIHAGNIGTALVKAAAATAAAPTLLFNAATGVLSFDADGTGAGAKVDFATLTFSAAGGAAAFGAGDFAFI